MEVFGKEIVREIWNIGDRNLQLSQDGEQIFNRRRCGVRDSEIRKDF